MPSVAKLELLCLRRPGALFKKTAPGPRKNSLLIKSFCRGSRGAVFSKRAPLVSLCACLVFLVGCSGNHVKLARDLQRNQYYEEALDHYFKALKAKPDRIDLKIDLDRLLKEASAYYFYLGNISGVR